MRARLAALAMMVATANAAVPPAEAAPFCQTFGISSANVTVCVELSVTPTSRTIVVTIPMVCVASTCVGPTTVLVPIVGACVTITQISVAINGTIVVYLGPRTICV